MELRLCVFIVLSANIFIVFGSVKRCPKNEEFSYCTRSICRPQYCSQRGQTLRQQEDNTSCKEGCVCKENFLRNYNGTCIPKSECGENCGPNEVLDECPVDCASDYCPTSDEESAEQCEKPDSDQCPPAVCKCRINYRRADNGMCIPTTDCPPFDCSAKPNEEYYSCPPLCPTDACSLPWVEGICPFKIGTLLICNPKCQCKDGYGRSDGTCVPFEECPNLCPKNEKYNSCTQGICRQQNCTTRNDPVACPRIDPSFCKRGCVCKENYYRNKNGICIQPDQCEDLPCGKNEVLDKCPVDCPSDYCPKCEEDNKRCPKPDSCPTPECKCRFSYRRADNGTCIPARDCPPFDCSAKPNEEYSPCPPICPTDACSLARLKGKCPFNIGILLQCNPKCQCEDGYGRKNGTCVPFEECPDLCPNNEEYNSCTQGVCRQQQCSTRNNPVACPSVEKTSCKRGCVCKENYYRNKNGTCVKSDECEDDTDLQGSCGVNEEVKCVFSCPPEKTCRNRDIEFNCLASIEPCEDKCVCKKGYYKNILGTCITGEQCDQCSGKNEFYACDSACDNECENISIQNRTNCPIKNIVCNRRCYCDNGFARDAKGNCISIEKCPLNKCSGVNEEYTDCKRLYPPELCFSLVARFKCVSDPPCEAGCACKPGFLRQKSDSPCKPICECNEMKNTPDCQ